MNDSGQLTSSVSGVPALIFSMLLFGCNASPSTNCILNLSAIRCPTVLLPHPLTPITIIKTGEVRCGLVPGCCSNSFGGLRRTASFGATSGSTTESCPFVGSTLVVDVLAEAMFRVVNELVGGVKDNTPKSRSKEVQAFGYPELYNVSLPITFLRRLIKVVTVRCPVKVTEQKDSVELSLNHLLWTCLYGHCCPHPTHGARFSISGIHAIHRCYPEQTELAIATQVSQHQGGWIDALLRAHGLLSPQL